MLKDKEIITDKKIIKENEINSIEEINTIKPFEIGQIVKIENIKRKILKIDKDNNVLVEVQIIDNQGNLKTVKQWYTIESVELI